VAIIITASAVLLNGLIWPYIQMRKSEDAMVDALSLWLTILGGIASWTLIPWAVWRNLRDASREKRALAKLESERCEHNKIVANRDASLAAAQKQALISEGVKDHWMGCYNQANTEKEDMRRTLDEMRGIADKWKLKAEELQSR
jgi:hypothetical protein